MNAMDTMHTGIPAPLRLALEKKIGRAGPVIVTMEIAFETWKKPPYQRFVRENKNVLAFSEVLAKTEQFSDALVVAVIDGMLYRHDCNHRLQAFKVAGAKYGLRSALAQVEFIWFDSMEDAARDYNRRQRQLSSSTPNDVLLGLSIGNAHLRHIKESCKSITYERVNANSGLMTTMATVLQCWATAANDTPAGSNQTIEAVAGKLTQAEAIRIVRFIKVCLGSWGISREYRSLWGAFNLTLCAWLYKRVVLGEQIGEEKITLLTDAQFVAALTGLTGGLRDRDGNTYITWVPYRRVSMPDDRRLAYNRIIDLCKRNLRANNHVGALHLPKPEWASALKKRVGHEDN